MGFFGGGGSAASNMVGATSSAAGTAGLVPAPAAGKQSSALLGDGTFAYSLHLPRTKSFNSRFVAPFNFESASSTSIYSAKIRNFVLFYFPVDGTINRISIFTGSAVTQNAHYAMWKYVENDATVGDLIYDIGTVSLNSLNNIHKDFSVSQTVTRGIMWISFTTDGTSAATRRLATQSGSWMAGASTGDFLGSTIGWNCDLGAGGSYDQTTNTTLSAGGSPALPYMYVRYA